MLVRYGDIHAVNTNEKWYSVLCMIIGVLYFFGSILGDMGSSMTNSDQKRAGFKHKLNAVSQYLVSRLIFYLIVIPYISFVN